MKNILAGLVASAACLSTAAPALAAPALVADAAPPSKTVSYSELNLQSAAGVQALYARLHAAARQVCAEQDGRSLREHIAYSSCVNSSLERAVRDLRNDAVLALHSEKSGTARRG